MNTERDTTPLPLIDEAQQRLDDAANSLEQAALALEILQGMADLAVGCRQLSTLVDRVNREAGRRWHHA